MKITTYLTNGIARGPGGRQVVDLWKAVLTFQFLCIESPA